MARHLGGESAESYERTRREARLPGLTGGQLQAFIAVAVRAGWKVGEVRSRMFRHSYCAARLQTLDHGAPVSPYAVARELGHGADSGCYREEACVVTPCASRDSNAGPSAPEADALSS